MQILITKPIRKILIANFEKGQKVRGALDENGDDQDVDFEPALKLFCPWSAATWLISELDPETNNSYGLAYLDGGNPEPGLIPIDEIEAIKHPSGLRIERDIGFDADGQQLSQYAKKARELGYIDA